MTEAGQNSAAPPPGLIKLVRAANSGREALREQRGGAGRAAVSLGFLNTLSDKGLPQRPPELYSLNVVNSQRIMFRGSSPLFRNKRSMGCRWECKPDLPALSLLCPLSVPPSLVLAHLPGRDWWMRVETRVFSVKT